MSWFAFVDGYCERLDAGLLAEPVNLVSNGAFLVMAYWLWPRAQPGSGARTLVILLAAIGLGSALFHSVAQRWAAVVDVTPILLFVLYYIYLANRQFWQLSRLLSLVGVALFFPYAAAVLWVFKDIEGLGSSLGYMPVPILIAVYAIGLHRRLPQVARGLWGGVLLLSVSLGLRTVDLQLCTTWPQGTHFLWHLINAAMLGWMIEVYRRHMLAGDGQQG